MYSYYSYVLYLSSPSFQSYDPIKTPFVSAVSLLCSSLCVTLLFLPLFLAVALSLCGSGSVIPQSDPVHLAKSIATLLQPKPRGSAVALCSLAHRKHSHRIMQRSYRQWFRVTNVHILPGVVSKRSLTFLLREDKDTHILND